MNEIIKKVKKEIQLICNAIDAIQIADNEDDLHKQFKLFEETVSQ